MNQRFVIDLGQPPVCHACKFCERTYGPKLVEVPSNGFFGSHYEAQIVVQSTGCTRVVVGGLDLITGEGDATKGPILADLARADPTLCGVQGRWYQPAVDNEIKD